MEKPQYYSITVKKMNILTRHSDWLVKTQELYNQILEFYYNLYLDTFQDGRPGSMEAVSYTHLDVYKRQVVPDPDEWDFLCRHSCAGVLVEKTTAESGSYKFPVSGCICIFCIAHSRYCSES